MRCLCHHFGVWVQVPSPAPNRTDLSVRFFYLLFCIENAPDTLHVSGAFRIERDNDTKLAEEGEYPALNRLLGNLRLLENGGLGFFAHSEGDGQLLAAAEYGQLYFIAGGFLADVAHQIGAGCDFFIVCLGDDVVELQTGLFSGAALFHHLHGCAGRQAVNLGFLGNTGNGNADVGLSDSACFDDALHEGHDGIHGNGKADIIDGSGAGSTVRRELGIGDADDLAVLVKQRAAGVAGVDGCVRLDQVHAGAAGEGDLSVQSADNAGGQRESQLAQGIADGNDAVADVDQVRVAQNNGGEALCLNFQHGHVVCLVIAHNLRIISCAVKHGDGDLAGRVDDMVVRENVAVIGENEAGTGRCALGLQTENIGGDDGGGDAHGGVDVLGVQLCGGQDLAGFHCVNLQIGGGAVAFENLRFAGGAAEEAHGAGAHQTAQKAAAYADGNNLAPSGGGAGGLGLSGGVIGTEFHFFVLRILGVGFGFVGFVFIRGVHCFGFLLSFPRMAVF